MKLEPSFAEVRFQDAHQNHVKSPPGRNAKSPVRAK